MKEFIADSEYFFGMTDYTLNYP